MPQFPLNRKMRGYLYSQLHIIAIVGKGTALGGLFNPPLKFVFRRNSCNTATPKMLQRGEYRRAFRKCVAFCFAHPTYAYAIRLLINHFALDSYRHSYTIVHHYIFLIPKKYLGPYHIDLIRQTSNHANYLVIYYHTKGKILFQYNWFHHLKFLPQIL